MSDGKEVGSACNLPISQNTFDFEVGRCRRISNPSFSSHTSVLYILSLISAHHTATPCAKHTLQYFRLPSIRGRNPAGDRGVVVLGASAAKKPWHDQSRDPRCFKEIQRYCYSLALMYCCKDNEQRPVILRLVVATNRLINCGIVGSSQQ